MTDNKERIGHCIGYRNTYTDKWEIAVCIENYADEYLYVADLNKTWFIVEQKNSQKNSTNIGAQCC